MKLAPVSLREASAYVEKYHRHHGKPRGWKFGVAVENARGRTVGVAIAGRPVARRLQDGRTLEVTRCCTRGAAKNAASMLYGAIARAGRALGFERVITYTLETEDGTSLRAAGFEPVAVTSGGEWDRPSRRRAKASAPTCPKVRWERAA